MGTAASKQAAKGKRNYQPENSVQRLRAAFFLIAKCRVEICFHNQISKEKANTLNKK